MLSTTVAPVLAVSHSDGDNNGKHHIVRTHIDSLDLNIPFHSHSDALFAAFLCSPDSGAALPIHVIDALLALLHNSNFIASQLTFASANDINAHIAAQRRQAALLRSESATYACAYTHTQNHFYTHSHAHTHACVPGSGTLPLLVLDLIVDQLSTERLPFSAIATAFDESTTSPPCVATAALRALALTHRTWTPFAQRILHSRIVVSGAAAAVSEPSKGSKSIGSAGALHTLLQHPALGPRTRELAFCAPFPAYQAASPPLQTARLLASVLARCTNLKHVYIAMSFAPQAGEVVFDELRERKEVERLWLMHRPSFPYYSDHPKLGGVVDVVKGLRKLKTLSLKNWGEAPVNPVHSGTDPNSEVDPELKSDTHLVALSYRARAGCAADTRLTFFLFEPCVTNVLHISSLELSLSDLAHYNTTSGLPSLLASIQAGLPYVIRLRLHCNFTDSDSDTSAPTALAIVLASCSSLDTLELVLEAGGLPTTLPSPLSLSTPIPSPIPTKNIISPVSTLHIHYTTPPLFMARSLQDTRLCALLSFFYPLSSASTPTSDMMLRKVFISFGPLILAGGGVVAALENTDFGLGHGPGPDMGMDMGMMGMGMGMAQVQGVATLEHAEAWCAERGVEIVKRGEYVLKPFEL